MLLHNITGGKGRSRPTGPDWFGHHAHQVFPMGSLDVFPSAPQELQGGSQPRGYRL